MSKNLNIWIEGTIIAALATVLSLVPFNIGPSFSVTVGAPVMMLYCLRRGLIPGFFASFPPAARLKNTSAISCLYSS